MEDTLMNCIHSARAPVWETPAMEKEERALPYEEPLSGLYIENSFKTADFSFVEVDLLRAAELLGAELRTSTRTDSPSARLLPSQHAGNPA